MPVPPPDISIVIVSWNVCGRLRACLASLPPPASGGVETIVVDAASSDGTPDMVRAEFPAVRLFASAENLGYSRGNNLGLEQAHGRYAFILNPDTELVGDGLRRMWAYLEANAQVGVVGPQLVLSDQTVQRSRRRFPNLATALFESTWLEPLTPRPVLARYYATDLPLDGPVEVDWLVGAALLVRRDVWEQVGKLDDGFFMYSEELDWQRRIKGAGWKIVYFPDAQVRHFEAQSSAQAPAATHIRFNTSKVRYFRKYHGAAAAEALRWYLLGHFAVQLALESVKGLAGHKRELRQARVAAYREVLRSRLRG
jgi:N-acetylglucosaminyl-diphospho-decaprenol L-rhamnosyltransferase